MSRPRGRTDKSPPIIRMRKDGVTSVPPSGSACCDCRGRYPLAFPPPRHTCISLPVLSLLSLKSPLVHMHHPLGRSTPSIPVSFIHLSHSHLSRLHSSMRLTQSPIFYPSTNRSDMDAIKKLRGPHSCRLPAGVRCIATCSHTCMLAHNNTPTMLVVGVASLWSPLVVPAGTYRSMGC